MAQNKNQMWTQEHKDILADLHANGVSIKTMARELGRSAASIQWYRRHLALPGIKPLPQPINAYRNKRVGNKGRLGKNRGEYILFSPRVAGTSSIIASFRSLDALNRHLHSMNGTGQLVIAKVLQQTTVTQVVE